MQTVRYKSLGLIVVVSIMLGGCDAQRSTSGATGILIDAGDSTVGMWKFYRADVHSLIRSLPTRERVYADKVSSNSAAFSNPCQVFLGKQDGDPTPMRDRIEAKKGRNDLADWADSVFDSAKLVGNNSPLPGHQSLSNTDILTALKLVVPF